MTANNTATNPTCLSCVNGYGLTLDGKCFGDSMGGAVPGCAKYNYTLMANTTIPSSVSCLMCQGSGFLVAPATATSPVRMCFNGGTSCTTNAWCMWIDMNIYTKYEYTMCNMCKPTYNLNSWSK